MQQDQQQQLRMQKQQEQQGLGQGSMGTSSIHDLGIRFKHAPTKLFLDSGCCQQADGSL